MTESHSTYVSRRRASSPEVEHHFFAWLAGSTVVLVFVGFARTYYLHSLFGMPALTRCLHFQGAVARALQQSFLYIRVFHSLDDRGFHFLASDHPIVRRSAQELADRMPERALRDLLEWGPSASAAQQLSIILGRELSLDQVTAGAPLEPALQDNLPANEYFFLRRYLHLNL